MNCGGKSYVYKSTSSIKKPAYEILTVLRGSFCIEKSQHNKNSIPPTLKDIPRSAEPETIVIY